jgi:hypothetical protein
MTSETVVTETVVTFGSHALQAQRAQLWAALEAGAAIHLVNLASGVHRGWLTANIDPGYEVKRIGCRQLGARMGQILEAVREGTTYEVVDHQTGDVRCYLTWCPPDAIAQDPGVSLAYQVRRQQGTKARLVREEFPSVTATRAEAVVS